MGRRSVLLAPEHSALQRPKGGPDGTRPDLRQPLPSRQFDPPGFHTSLLPSALQNQCRGVQSDRSTADSVGRGVFADPTLAGLRGGRQWQRLFAAIDLLRADDLRVMKRSFPSRWLVSLLTARRKPDILQTASFERSLPFRCRGGHHQPFLKS